MPVVAGTTSTVTSWFDDASFHADNNAIRALLAGPAAAPSRLLLGLRKGTIHQAYRDGMEDQLGSLGLVLNAVVLWTTGYVDAAVAQIRTEGHEIKDEDIARLSPLKHKNLNVLGRYSFTTSTPAGGGLRPLRDPDAIEKPRPFKNPLTPFDEEIRKRMRNIP